MHTKAQKIVIVGGGETAEIAYEYFTHASLYEVCAFSAERAFLTRADFLGLPIVPFEALENFYPPSEYGLFVALSYTQLNRPRTRLYKQAKEKGFAIVSYVSPQAFLWHSVEIGENCFLFENNVLQHRVKVGNNVVLWSGNHIGHRSVIHDNCYLASHVVVSGYCDIGENCFFGVNSCVADHVKIAPDCIIGAGAVVLADTEPGKVYRGNPATPSHIDSFTIFRVKRP